MGDEFVQFKLNHRILYGEVGSREWAAPDDRRPLDADAQALLADLGFTHGGPERNYICDNLAQSAPYLADLYLRLAVAAYAAVPETLAVKSNVDAVRKLAGPLARRPGFTWPAADPGRHKQLRTTPVASPSPGLQFRAERALRSNFAEIGSTTEELEALRTRSQRRNHSMRCRSGRRTGSAKPRKVRSGWYSGAEPPERQTVAARRTPSANAGDGR